MKTKMIAVAVVGTVLAAAGKEPADCINPYIGSVSHMLVPTFRTVQRPNAMYRFNSPDGNYTEDRVGALWLQNPGHRDAPVFSVRPCSGTADGAVGKWATSLDQLHVAPWRYDVRLDASDVTFSLAPGERSAIATFAFHRAEPHTLAFGLSDAKGGSYAAKGATLDGVDVFHGMRGCKARVFLHAEFDRAPSAVRREGDWLLLKFGDKAETVTMRFGISYVSPEQAARNLAQEIPGRDLEAVAAAARKRVNAALATVEVEGGSDDERSVFYTALWRTFERMVNITEDGRYYSGFDGRVHETGGVDYYTDDWTWDSFRAHHPLMTILRPKAESDKLASYVRMAEADPEKWVPVFPGVAGDRHCMVNRHPAIMFLDAWRKGIRGFDAKRAFALMDNTEETESLIPWHRGPLTELDRFYKAYGYYPGLRPGEKEWVKEVHTDWERRQCVSVTQGASYDAWALAQFARELGLDAAAYAKYDERAKGYAKLWNPKTQFFHPTDKDGKFIEPFDYMVCGGFGARNYYTENNAWTYIWDVQHDLPGLLKLFGGGAAMERKLDTMLNTSVGCRWTFTADMPDGCTGLMGAFTMANEPAFHIPYLYNYAGQPWKTQKFVRKTLETWFRNDKMGICGDEDGGGMSAYAVFSMMGFYPVTPGLPEYQWGSPVFRKVTIHLENGRDFTIEAPAASPDAKYVRSVTVDGVRGDATVPLRHADILKGAKVCVEMSTQPEIRPPAEPQPNLVLGVISDVHVMQSVPNTTNVFRRTLAYFDRRKVDGVVACGDLTDGGTIPELQEFARIWYEVFPNDRRSDGGHVEKLFVYGDHDTEPFHVPHYLKAWSKDPKVLEARRRIDIDQNDRAVQWKAAFHEDFAPIMRKTVKGYDFVLAHLVNLDEPGMRYGDPLHIPGLEEFFATNRFPTTRPFFYVQHKLYKGMSDGFVLTGQDSGRTSAVLSKHPNAFAFCGHKHRGCQAEYSLWQGAFTALEVPGYRVQTYGGHENGWCSCERDDANETLQMPMLETAADGSQALVMKVYDDRIVIERRNVVVEGEVAAPWEIPLPNTPFDHPASFANRAKKAVAPQFADGTKVGVRELRGKNRAGQAVDQVEVSFATARSTAKTPRAYDYEVRAVVRKSFVTRTALAKRVYSPKCCLPETADTNAVTCVFSKAEIPHDHDSVTFEVVPMDSFGHEGKPIRSAPQTFTHTPCRCPF